MGNDVGAEFLMRFGLSDLEELPSLKEFEALAREALGSDMGLAPTSEDAMLGEPHADTVENLTAGGNPGRPAAATSAPGSHGDARSDLPGETVGPAPAHHAQSDAEFLREEEVTATGEGMPSGELDEEPPRAEAATSAE